MQRSIVSSDNIDTAANIYTPAKRLSLGLMLVAALAPVAAGCTGDMMDEDDPEVSTTVSEITIPVGRNGCGSLYRTSSSSQNVYLAGCGNKFFGNEYRVPFNGFNVYFCFSYTGSQFVGQQADLAGSFGQSMPNPVAYSWCNAGFPSLHSYGG